MQSPQERPHRHYTRAHRIVSWVSRTLFSNVTYTVRRGLLKGMKRRGGLAWMPDFRPRPESPQERFFSSLDLSGKVVFDIGAFEGLLTMFFARGARHVVCYEPNPRNRARLLHNLELNGIRNVTVRPYGLGAAAGAARMIWDPGMPGGSTVDGTGIAGAIDQQAGAQQEEIQLTTVDADLMEQNLLEPDIVKVDVEGFELPVLQGARRLLERKHPILNLEMHGETMAEKERNVRAIVEYLVEVGYRRIEHVESGRTITLENCAAAAQGHLYARQ